MSQASLGFALFDRHLQSILDMLKGDWKEHAKGGQPPYTFLALLQEKMRKRTALNHLELGRKQAAPKERCDSKVGWREFEPNQQVVLLLPTVDKLQVRWQGFFRVR